MKKKKQVFKQGKEGWAGASAQRPVLLHLVSIRYVRHLRTKYILLLQVFCGICRSICWKTNYCLLSFLFTLFTPWPSPISELGEKRKTQRWEIFCFVDIKRQKFYLYRWGELLRRSAGIIIKAQNNFSNWRLWKDKKIFI